MREILLVALTDTHLKDDNVEVNLSIYRQSLEFCKEHGITHLYHFGDGLTSRKSQSLLILSTFSKILDMCRSYGITLVYIPGNHDKTSYQHIDSFLHPFQHHPYFTLVDTYFFFEHKNICVHLLPFFSDDVYREVLSVSIQSWQQLEKPNLPDILLTHIGIEGAKMNNGMLVEGIKQSDFDLFTKVYIGHYHDKQVFGKFNYVGSSIQHNYGETPDKGLTAIYTDLSFDTIPLDFPKYLKLEVDIDKLTAEDIREIQTLKETSNDHLRVILVGSEEKVKSFNKQQFSDIGVSVQMKIDEIKKSDIDERVEPFNSKSLFEEFEVFCVKQNLQSDKQRGLTYLQKSLNNVPS